MQHIWQCRMLWLILCGLLALPVQAGEIIRICGDAAVWPPYTFEQDNEVRGLFGVLALILLRPVLIIVACCLGNAACWR